MSEADVGAADLRDAPLGHPSGHPDRYEASLLFVVPRAPQRAALGIGVRLPFTGIDAWTAYELTWLDANRRGHPFLVEIVNPIPAQRCGRIDPAFS